MVESFNMREAFPFDSLSSDVKIVGLFGIQPNTKEDAGGALFVGDRLQDCRTSKILFYPRHIIFK